MSTTSLETFDRTLHHTHIWLDEIMARFGPDKWVAWRVLGAVLSRYLSAGLLENAPCVAQEHCRAVAIDGRITISRRTQGARIPSGSINGEAT